DGLPGDLDAIDAEGAAVLLGRGGLVPGLPAQAPEDESASAEADPADLADRPGDAGAVDDARFGVALGPGDLHRDGLPDGPGRRPGARQRPVAGQRLLVGPALGLRAALVGAALTGAHHRRLGLLFGGQRGVAPVAPLTGEQGADDAAVEGASFGARHLV